MAAPVEEGPVVFWHKDRCSQPCCLCGKSSIEVLLDWLAVSTDRGFVNYTRWKGGVRTKDAVSKKTLAKEISTLMQQQHGLVRNVPSVIGKIGELQTKFSKARDFLDHTGSGLLEALDNEYKDKDKYADDYIQRAKTIHVRVRASTTTAHSLL
jgi:hypothetical protein